MIEAVEDIDPFDRAVLAMIKMPTDQLIFVRVGLLFNRVVEDQHTVFPLHRAHHRFNLLPQVFRCVVGLRKKARDTVMAYLAVQQSGKTRRRRRAKRTQQIIAIEG